MSVTYGKLVDRVRSALRDSGNPRLEEITQAQVQIIVRTVFEQISDAIAHGEDVSLDKFGRFYPDVKKPRTVKSSLTNQVHRTGYKATVRFSPYADVKRRAAEFIGSILGMEVGT